MPSRRRPRLAADPRSGAVTTHVYRGYVFTIRFSVEDPWWIVRFADIPEIITSGPTLARAFANACEALDLCLETYEKFGSALPKVRHRLIVKRSANTGANRKKVKQSA